MTLTDKDRTILIENYLQKGLDTIQKVEFYFKIMNYRWQSIEFIMAFFIAFLHWQSRINSQLPNINN